MDDGIVRSHCRQQQDKIKYEFTMKLIAFNIKEAVLDGSISAKDQLLRYKQGDGITLRSVEYHAFKYNVRFRDIFCGDIQLFEKTNPSFEHPDFFYAAGRTRDARLYGPIYQAFLRIIHGDSGQTLRVLIAYYRQKTESLMYTAALAKQDKLKSDSFIASLSISKKDKLSMHKPVVAHVESEHKGRINYELSHERTSQY